MMERLDLINFHQVSIFHISDTLLIELDELYTLEHKTETLQIQILSTQFFHFVSATPFSKAQISSHFLKASRTSASRQRLPFCISVFSTFQLNLSENW